MVTKATSPFNTFGKLAFQHVTTLVDSLSSGRPVPALCPGQLCRVDGLANAPELNGAIGVCVGAESNGRCPVQLVKLNKVVGVRLANLTLVEDVSELERAARGQTGGGESGG